MRSHPNKTAKVQSLQDMRRKIIALLMSWKPDQFGIWSTSQMRHVPDMPKIYEWINQYGHKHPKWLNKYTYKELTELVSQIEIITSSPSNGESKKDKKPKSRDP